MSFKSPDNKLLHRLLGFKNLRITDHKLCPGKGVLKLLVKPYKNGAQCPHCQRCGKVLKRSAKQAARDARVWSYIPAIGLAVTLTYCPREIISARPTAASKKTSSGQSRTAATRCVSTSK
jgi:hypothetical protein